RLQVLLLRREIHRELINRPADHHLLLSFYLSTAGFVAQHVASEFGLAHVACARGSDVGRDIFTQDGVGAVEFVLRRASCVVTMNLEHRRFIRDIIGRREDVYTIYNAIPPHVRPVWTRNTSGTVRLVSLGGYSVKKGTNILLKSVAQ